MRKIKKWNDLGRWLIPELGKRGINTTDFAEMLGTSRPYLWQMTHTQDFIKPVTERKWMLAFQDALDKYDEKNRERIGV